MGKVAAIIPARWGSTRFPGKPLHEIAGKPLLRHVWERCQRARSIDSVIIATDDMRIASEAFEWGAEVALTGRRHRSGTDRIAEVIAAAPAFSHVVNVQGDEPLIDPRLIDRIVTELRQDRHVEMVTAAHPFLAPADAASPHQVKVVLSREGDALYFSRAPIPFNRAGSARQRYLRHQGIYGYTRRLLLQFVRWKPAPLETAESLEQLRALENGVRIRVVVTRSGSPGVDTLADVKIVERKLIGRPRRVARKRNNPESE